MNHIECAQALAQNQYVFQSLLQQASGDQLLWRPHPEHWCLLEIVCHLLDIEVEDFRARAAFMLNGTKGKMPSIEPVNWVKDRRYIEQNFEETLQRFLEERTKSVEWLKGLEHPNFERTYEHSYFRSQTADFFLTNWVAHDYLHIRQITRIQYLYLKDHAAVEIEYAGNWS